MAPYFTQTFKEVDVSGGTILRIECQPFGVPEPVIQWSTPPVSSGPQFCPVHLTVLALLARHFGFLRSSLQPLTPTLLRWVISNITKLLLAGLSSLALLAGTEESEIESEA